MVQSRRELAIYLSRLKVFDRPNIRLEQYASDGDVAAKLLWQANLDGNIQDKIIIDLGCGTGILGIGALLLGAKHILFVDIDASIQTLLDENLETLKADYHFPGTYEFISSDVRHFLKTADTIITNPPFGTKIKHADKQFLETAKRCSNHIYSMHKSSTKSFLEAYAKTNDLTIGWLESTSFPLKNTYRDHKKKIERIAVDIIYLHK